MKGLPLLLFGLSVLVPWVTVNARPNSITQHKRALAAQANGNLLPVDGERCRLARGALRPPQAPQHQPFGLYPRRLSASLGSTDEGTAMGPRSSLLSEGHQGENDTSHGNGRKDRKIRSTAPRRGADGLEETVWHGQNRHRSKHTSSKSHSERDSTISPARLGRSKRRPRHADEAGNDNIDELDPKHQGQTGPSQGQLQTLRETLYFSRKREEVLVVRPEAVGQQLPRREFTIEVWVKAEGGQGNPAIIAGLFDNCSHVAGSKGWTLGIHSAEHNGRKDARFYFNLRTDRARASTTVSAPQNYLPGTWTHLAASYEGQRMTLFVNGVRVASHGGQTGALHSHFMTSCRTLIVGGDNSESRHAFRGHLGSLVLWSKSLSPENLKRRYQTRVEDEHADIVFNASFAHLEKQWEPFQDSVYPLVEMLSVPELDVVSPLLPPPCGQTVCDNLEVISNYNTYWPLRKEKRIHYRVVNVCEDDGSNPTITREQINHQHEALTEAFDRYNISWQLSIHEVRNSSLRLRVILASCESGKIGNDHCDPECDHPLTGYDGGDCRIQGRCYTWKKGDGICHQECNNMLENFDDGDCCDPDITDVRKTCFDPDSPERYR